MRLIRSTVALALTCAVFAATLAVPAPQTVAQTIGEPTVSLRDGFVDDVVAGGFDNPTAFAFLPDDRILVAEQSGVVKLVKNGVTLQAPAVDLSAIVNSRAERGLLGIAADPEFASNGYVYLLYTRDDPTKLPDDWDPMPGLLSRFTMRGDVIDPDSERVLFDDYRSEVAYHSLGTLRFGKGGVLFVSLGDGALPGDVSSLTLRAQGLDNLQGKILRIDPATGEGLASNPFYEQANPRSAQSRIFAYGFRNPFRFALHPETGLPYVGNVGWFTWEAIYRVTPGANVGWPCVENVVERPEYRDNDECDGIRTTTVAPFEYAYMHDGTYAAIVGGDFNVGTHFPAEMSGDYFFGDYNKGFIRRAVINEFEHVSAVEDFATNVDSPVDIQFGLDGALYYLSINGSQLHRISNLAANQPPQAQIAATVAGAMDRAARAFPAGAAFVQAYAPLTVTLNAGASVDPDGLPLTYTWLLGDRVVASRQLTATQVFTQPGRFLARLVATDAQGFDDVATQVILALPRPAPGAVIAPSRGDVFPPGAQVRLAAAPLSGTVATTATWSVTAFDGGVSRTVPVSNGSFAMPELGGDGWVEVAQRTTGSGRPLGATGVVTIYAAPKDGYIRNWWFIPGRPNRYLEFDALPGGERTFAAPDPAVQAVWARSDSRKVDLAKVLDPDEHTAGYAFVWVDSPQDRHGLLGLLSDDGIKAWLNGELVWTHKTSRYVEDDERDIDLPPIRLKKGLNPLLIKVDQNIGEWALKARVLNPDGSIMRDVTLRTDLSAAALAGR